MNYSIDGAKALADQENDLNGVELANYVKVTAYAKQAGSKMNVASTANAPPGIHPLYLAMVDAGASTGATVQQQQAQGRGLVFTGTAYVSGGEKTVMGFRQP